MLPCHRAKGRGGSTSNPAEALLLLLQLDLRQRDRLLAGRGHAPLASSEEAVRCSRLRAVKHLRCDCAPVDRIFGAAPASNAEPPQPCRKTGCHNWAPLEAPDMGQ